MTRTPLAVAVVTLIGVSWLAANVRILVGCVAVAFVAGVARRMLSDARRSRERRARQLAVIEVCDALGAELRAGLPAASSVERAFGNWPRWAPIVTASRMGGDVPAAIRHASALPGAEGLRAVAAGWAVAGRSGVALADVLDRVAAGLRADDEARAEVVAALGPPRATAKMLAVLPIFGVLLGSSMGARPLEFLLTTTAGEVSLAAGLVLAALGVFWVERLAAAAEV